MLGKAAVDLLDGGGEAVELGVLLAGVQVAGNDVGEAQLDGGGGLGEGAEGGSSPWAGTTACWDTHSGTLEYLNSELVY